MGAFLAATLSPKVLASDAAMRPDGIGNFRYIYSDPQLKREFLDFLTNVFHLYPEHELHAALSRLATSRDSDREVYEALQAELGDLSPSSARSAMPSRR